MANIDDREVLRPDHVEDRWDRTDGLSGRDLTIRVLLVEDHELVRRGLVDLMTASGDLAVVGTATTAAEALPLVATADPQVVLLDARLGDGSGIAACRQLRSQHPELPCVLLTAAEDDEALVAAVLGGAAGYLAKQVGGSSLLDGVRAVAAGRALLEPPLVERLLDRLRTSWPGGVAALDEREQEVLELVGLGSTDGQIAEKLDLPEVTVRDQVAGLVAKLVLRHQGLPAAVSRPALPDRWPALR
jgi:two-component system, NarL family, response regulator DevR